MKILYIGGFELPDKNAAAHRVLANAKALKEAGHEVKFIGITKSKDLGGILNGFSYKANQYPKTLKEWINFTFSNVKLSDIEKEHPDTIIAYNYPGFSLFSLYLFCKKNKIRLICDITEWYETKGWNIKSIVRRLDCILRMNYLNKKVDGIIAISSLLEKNYKKYTSCIIVPPLIDKSDIITNKSFNSNCNKRIKLVYAGNPSATKDKIDEIINAVSQISNIEFIVIGITKEEYLEIYKHQNILPSNVTFLGKKTHKDTLDILRECDFQIFYRESNRVNNAGFPTKFVESLFCGLPVITTLTSDIGKYLIEGENGLVISGKRNIQQTIKFVSKLGSEKINEMKHNALLNNAFDYHNYISDLDKLCHSHPS